MFSSSSPNMHDCGRCRQGAYCVERMWLDRSRKLEHHHHLWCLLLANSANILHIFNSEIYSIPSTTSPSLTKPPPFAMPQLEQISFSLSLLTVNHPPDTRCHYCRSHAFQNVPITYLPTSSPSLSTSSQQTILSICRSSHRTSLNTLSWSHRILTDRLST